MSGLTLIGVHDRAMRFVSALAETVQFPDKAHGQIISPSMQEDFCVMLYYALIVFAINWALRLTFIQPIGKYLILQGTHDKRGIDDKTAKFAQSWWEMICYSGFFLIGLTVWTTRPWAWPSTQWFAGKMSGEVDHLPLHEDLAGFCEFCSAVGFEEEKDSKRVAIAAVLPPRP